MLASFYVFYKFDRKIKFISIRDNSLVSYHELKLELSFSIKKIKNKKKHALDLQKRTGFEV